MAERNKKKLWKKWTKEHSELTFDEEAQELMCICGATTASDEGLSRVQREVYHQLLPIGARFFFLPPPPA